MTEKARVEYREERLPATPAAQIAILALLALCISLVGLHEGFGLGDHEAIVAQGATEMRRSGDWLIPTVNGDPFVRKPPLAFWQAAAASVLVDGSLAVEGRAVSPLAARLPSALSASALTILIYLLGRSLFGHRSGLIAGAVFCASVGGLIYGHRAQIEMTLAFWVSLALACFWWATESPRRPWAAALMFGAFAMAMLAKAPLPLVMVGLPAATWWFVAVPVLQWAESRPRGAPGISSRRTWRRAVIDATVRQLRGLRGLHLVPGIIAVALVLAPWPLYVHRTVPNALDLWHLEFLDRYTGDLGSSSEPAWYYLPVILALMLPFSFGFFEAVASPFMRPYAGQRRGLLFAWTWAATSVVFLSTSSFKRAHYLMCVLPAFALLLGPTLERFFLAARRFPQSWMRGAAAGVGILVVVGWFCGERVVRQEYPALVQSCRVAALLAGIALTVAVGAFCLRRRVLSLGTLLAGVTIVHGWMWIVVGRESKAHGEVAKMVAELHANRIGPEDRLTWVMGRPDSRLGYYLGRPIAPLFGVMELAELRDTRRKIPHALLLAGRDRLEHRLTGPEEEYFVIAARYWNLLRENSNMPARQVFRVPADSGDPRDDWVVFTNAWNTGEEEDQPGGATVIDRS